MPGSVSVAFNSDSTPKIIATLMATAMLANTPNSPVGQEHEHDDHDRADIGGKFALFDRILAEPRPDGAFLDDRQRRRQRAGAQQDRQIVGRLHGEIAGNLSGAAGDRFADHGRGNHLIVEHDRERLPDILRRRFARICASRAELKRKLTIGSPDALVEAGLRIGQVAAGDQTPAS